MSEWREAASKQASKQGSGIEKGKQTIQLNLKGLNTSGLSCCCLFKARLEQMRINLRSSSSSSSSACYRQFLRHLCRIIAD